MMQATFTIPIAEFNFELVEKIKNLLNGDIENTEIFISVRSKKPSMLRTETREAYFARLDESIDSIKKGRAVVSFNSLEELESFSKKMTPVHAEDTV